MLLEAFWRSSKSIFQVMMVLEDSDEIGINECLCLPKAELNTKNSTKRHRKALSFWCSTRFTGKKVPHLTE